MSDTKQVFVSEPTTTTRGRKKTSRQKSVPTNFITEIKQREKNKSKRLMKLIGNEDEDELEATMDLDIDNEEFKDDFDGGFSIIPKVKPPQTTYEKPAPRSILKGGPTYVPKTRKQVYVAPPSVISGSGVPSYSTDPSTPQPEIDKKKKLHEMTKLEKFIARRALSKVGSVFGGTRKRFHKVGKNGNSIRMFVFTKKQHREKVDKLKKDIQDMNPEKIKEELKRKKLLSNPATPDNIAKDIYENLLLLNANVKITKE
jgi:hypothetical protein